MVRDGSRRRRDESRSRWLIAAACCLLLGELATPAHGQVKGWIDPAAASRTAAILALHEQHQWETARADWLGGSLSGGRTRNVRLRIEPLFAGMATLLQRWGIPAQEVRDGHRAVAVAATFRLGDDLPDIKLHLGKRGAEPFGAFFASHKAMRWAVVLPLDRFTLRVEGGKDSEFGYMAIAGLQWTHPNKPIAIGFGIPAHMKRTDGEFAAIAQLRLNFGK